MHACMLSSFSHVQLFVMPWSVAHQAPLSMGFARQEYLSRLPCPPPGYLPDPGIELASLTSPALTGRLLTNCANWQGSKEDKWNSEASEGLQRAQQVPLELEEQRDWCLSHISSHRGRAWLEWSPRVVGQGEGCMAVSWTQECGAQERVSMVAGGPAKVRWRGVTLKGTQPQTTTCKAMWPAETQGGVGGRSQGWGLSGHLEEQHECQICPHRGISSGLQKLPIGESKHVGGTPLPPPQALVLGPCTDQALSWSALSPLHAPSLEGPEGDLSRGGTGEMSTVFLLPYFEFLSLSQAWAVTWIWGYSLEVDWIGLPSTCKGRLFINK